MDGVLSISHAERDRLSSAARRDFRYRLKTYRKKIESRPLPYCNCRLIQNDEEAIPDERSDKPFGHGC